MQIDAGGNGSLDKRLVQAVLAEDDQRNGPFDARAAARFYLHKIIRSSRKRGLAHVFSLGNAARISHGNRSALVLPGELRRSLDPRALMLAEARFVVE